MITKNNPRSSGRKLSQIREVSIQTGILTNSHGSCLIKLGNTHVICSASLENTVPRFLRNQQQGWLTAEYGMLPGSTNERIKREAKAGRISGRTQEIERLIGRSLRAAIDLKMLGERQIIIDCDVINADGGTRTAAVTGSYVALHLAITNLLHKRIITHNPLKSQIAAISCGIINDSIMTDLDYKEDSNAEVDANFVFNQAGDLIELQSSAEKKAFSTAQLQNMLEMAHVGVSELFIIQNKALLNL